ncbi:MAG: hypothetical protein ACK5K7_02385 [Bacilli bacterium]
MIYKDIFGNEYKIYAVFYLDSKLKYIYADFGFDSISQDELSNIISDITLKNNTIDEKSNANFINCISESKYLDASYYNLGYCTNFANSQEKIEFEEKMKKFEKELPEINQRIEIDYIQWKVKNGKFEEWQNNFDDKIIELSDTERFIDDDNYDIFYDINDLDNIKVVKKAS